MVSPPPENPEALQLAVATEALSQPTETPAAVILTPEPRQSFTNEFMRREALKEIQDLRMVLKEYLNPNILEPYNQSYFDNLERSSDNAVIRFLRASKVDERQSINVDRFDHRWKLVRLMDDQYANILVRYDGFYIEGRGIDGARRIDISTFIHPRLLPNTELLTERGSGNEFGIIREDRIEQAARSIFNLPPDIRWFTVPPASSLYHGGVRGLAILDDGTSMDVRITNYGSADLLISKATVHLFPVG